MNRDNNIEIQVFDDGQGGIINNQNSSFIIISKIDYNVLIKKDIYNTVYIITEV